MKWTYQQLRCSGIAPKANEACSRCGSVSCPHGPKANRFALRRDGRPPKAPDAFPMPAARPIERTRWGAPKAPDGIVPGELLPEVERRIIRGAPRESPAPPVPTPRRPERFRTV